MNKCIFCLNGRTIVSESGFHNICCLSDKQSCECLLKIKDHFIKILYHTIKDDINEYNNQT